MKCIDSKLKMGVGCPLRQHMESSRKTQGDKHKPTFDFLQTRHRYLAPSNYSTQETGSVTATMTQMHNFFANRQTDKFQENIFP